MIISLLCFNTIVSIIQMLGTNFLQQNNYTVGTYIKPIKAKISSL